MSERVFDMVTQTLVMERRKSFMRRITNERLIRDSSISDVVSEFWLSSFRCLKRFHSSRSSNALFKEPVVADRRVCFTSRR